MYIFFRVIEMYYLEYFYFLVLDDFMGVCLIFNQNSILV